MKHTSKGVVISVSSVIVEATDLHHAKLYELVEFGTGEEGQIVGLKKDSVEIMVFSKLPIAVGTNVFSTGSFLEVPVGETLLGKSIDSLGHPLNHAAVFPKTTTFRRTDKTPESITTRSIVKQKFATGVTIVDLLIPLGKGQRELIIGDRKTGKSTFLLQATRNHIKSGGICIYACIGKKRLEIERLRELFHKEKLDHAMIIVATSADDPASLIYHTPYTAMTQAEYFKDMGQDVLVILDDLLTHAKFYREIALLSKRFPGRNSYPADIFYTHSRLLERAGNFIHKKGDASITCLPVAETSQGDLTGYIQTNLMSMTDGHIFFDSDLFNKGARPAINPFLSVTRVGKQTQTKLAREMTHEITSLLTLYDKMKKYIHFAPELTDNAKVIIETGNRIELFFNQQATDVLPYTLQLFLFAMMWDGFWNADTPEHMKKHIRHIIKMYTTHPKVKEKIDALIENADSFNILLKNIKDTYAHVAVPTQQPKNDDNQTAH